MRRSTYQRVFDIRKRRVRGLWQRNGWFYARLAATDETTGLKLVRTGPTRISADSGRARAAMQDLFKGRREQDFAGAQAQSPSCILLGRLLQILRDA